MNLTDGTNDQLMVIAAHRYCLGRQSYIVGACIEWLYNTWDQFTANTRQVVLRDTVAALMDEQAGSPIIALPVWRDFARWGMDKLTVEQRECVRGSLSHKQQAWPL